MQLLWLVRSSSPEVIGRAIDIARKAARTLFGTASGGDPLTEVALYAKLDAMRAEIAGEDSTPLEILLKERVVLLWMFTSLPEVLMATQYRRNVGHHSERLSPVYLIQQSRVLGGIDPSWWCFAARFIAASSPSLYCDRRGFQEVGKAGMPDFMSPEQHEGRNYSNVAQRQGDRFHMEC